MIAEIIAPADLVAGTGGELPDNRGVCHRVEWKSMSSRKLRKLAKTDPTSFLRAIKGARGRDLAARQLLLHPEEVGKASAEDLNALREYVEEKRWRSLYHHDRRMYRLLRMGAEKAVVEQYQSRVISRGQVAKLLGLDWEEAGELLGQGAFLGRGTGERKR